MKSGINLAPRAVFLALVFFSRVMAQAQNDDGIWSKNGGGSWANSANWDSGTIADGEDHTATFGISIYPVPTSATFTLDGARSIGDIQFLAQSGPVNWVLNTGSGGPLTLDNTFNSPSIYVSHPSQTVAINTVLAGADGMEKSGDGTLILNAINIYSGETIVSGGTLRVNGIIGPDAVTVANGTLGGTGVITGPVIVQAEGILAPGNPLGTLTISNSLALQPGCKTAVEVNASTLGHDAVNGLSGMNYGGTLTVSNLAGTPTLGQSFQIFNAGSASGNFTTILPQLSGAVRWRFDSASGVLSVVTTNSQPKFASITLLGKTNLVMHVTNGIPGTTNYVLASTNVALPRTNWTRLATNVFDASGNFNFTNVVNPITAQKFYQVLIGP